MNCIGVDIEATHLNSFGMHWILVATALSARSVMRPASCKCCLDFGLKDLLNLYWGELVAIAASITGLGKGALTTGALGALAACQRIHGGGARGACSRGNPFGQRDG